MKKYEELLQKMNEDEGLWKIMKKYEKIWKKYENFLYMSQLLCVT